MNDAARTNERWNMSKDEAVTKHLISVLEDGADGFTKAAERLTQSNEPGLASTFQRFSGQRSGFANELREIAAQYGDQIHDSGSIAGALHRGWISVKDMLSGSDAEAVLGAARTGEDHAVSEFEDALEEDTSPELKAVISRQAADVRAARDEVAALQVQAS